MEKKPVISLTDGLSEGNVFFLTTSLNYNDKIVLYNRGIVKTEIIDGEELLGKSQSILIKSLRLIKRPEKESFIRLSLSMKMT